MRANIYYQQEDRDKAQADYQIATELEATASDANHKRDEHGYYARGLARYQIGADPKAAIKDLEIALEIATRHRYARFIEKTRSLIAEIKQQAE